MKQSRYRHDTDVGFGAAVGCCAASLGGHCGESLSESVDKWGCGVFVNLGFVRISLFGGNLFV